MIPNIRVDLRDPWFEKRLFGEPRISRIGTDRNAPHPLGGILVLVLVIVLDFRV